MLCGHVRGGGGREDPPPGSQLLFSCVFMYWVFARLRDCLFLAATQFGSSFLFSTLCSLVGPSPTNCPPPTPCCPFSLELRLFCFFRSSQLTHHMKELAIVLLPLRPPPHHHPPPPPPFFAFFLRSSGRMNCCRCFRCTNLHKTTIPHTLPRRQFSIRTCIFAFYPPLHP